jgi:phosphate transport system substrate-binding protein
VNEAPSKMMRRRRESHSGYPRHLAEILKGPRLRLAKLIALSAAVLTGGGVASTTAARAAAGLVGAGSTVVVPLEAEWAQAFQALHAVSVTYDPRGPVVGISELSSRSVDFAVTDEPMSAVDSAGCHGCYQIPWALSAVGVGYHINGVGPTLRLSGRILAEIFLGQITRWNDSQIQSLNPRLHMPALRITPVYRVDAAGETYAFTSYLSAVNSTWNSRVGRGTIVSFPAGIHSSDNLGVTTTLESTNGSIGYVAVSYLIAHRVPAAAIQNAAGKFEYPNLTNIENAAQSVKRVPANNALNIINPPKRSRIAYPISTFSYVIVPAQPAQRTLVAQWIGYALGVGRDFAAALDFAAMPPVVLKASRATLKKLR